MFFFFPKHSQELYPPHFRRRTALITLPLDRTLLFRLLVRPWFLHEICSDLWELEQRRLELVLSHETNRHCGKFKRRDVGEKPEVVKCEFVKGTSAFGTDFIHFTSAKLVSPRISSFTIHHFHASLTYTPPRHQHLCTTINVMESSDGEAALLRRQKCEVHRMLSISSCTDHARRLFDDPHMSDFTITAQSVEIKVHKVFLSVYSPYFDRIFCLGSKVRYANPHSWQRSDFHAQDAIATHYAFEVPTSYRSARAMLRHIYGFDLVREEGGLHGNVLGYWTELLGLAVKYEIQSLSKLAETRITSIMRSLQMDQLVCRTRDIYRLESSKGARHIANQVCRENLDGVMASVYTKSLLEDFPELAAALVKAEFDDEPETAHSRLQEAMKQNRLLGFGLLKELAKSSPTAESKKRKRDP